MPYEINILSPEPRLSRLTVCLRAAPQFLLSDEEAHGIIDAQIESIHRHWTDVCTEAGLSDIDAKLFWGRQFLNPDAMAGYSS